MLSRTASSPVIGQYLESFPDQREKVFPLISLLLEKGASPDVIIHEYPVLHQVISTPNDQLFYLLLNNGPNVDVVGPDGFTPLLRPINLRRYVFAKALIQRGAGLMQGTEQRRDGTSQDCQRTVFDGGEPNSCLKSAGGGELVVCQGRRRKWGGQGGDDAAPFHQTSFSPPRLAQGTGSNLFVEFIAWEVWNKGQSSSSVY